MAKKKRADIPQSGDELTPAWFSTALGSKVMAVDRSVIGEGIGFLGELHRCDLTWENGDAPLSVVVKIPSKNLTNRAAGEGLMAYEREILAYRDMRADLGLRMPHHHYSAFDPDPVPWMERPIELLFEKLPVRGVNWMVLQFLKLSGKSKRRYLLMIEHIADAKSPTQVEGGSLGDVLKALEVLARFHAHHWMSTKPTEISPRIWSVTRTPKIWQAGYLRCREEFVTGYGSVVGDEVIARLDEVQENFAEVLGRLGEPPWTLLHGDYRIDNLLYRDDGELVVVDFQLLSTGRPGVDVGYFITTALNPDHHEEEEQMLRHYHGALTAAGIDDYSSDQLVADVETTKLILAHRFVGAIDTLDTHVEGQDASFVELMLERVIGWIR